MPARQQRTGDLANNTFIALSVSVVCLSGKLAVVVVVVVLFVVVILAGVYGFVPAHTRGTLKIVIPLELEPGRRREPLCRANTRIVCAADRQTD